MQEQAAQEIVDRLEQSGISTGDVTEDENIVSSTINEDGAVVNKYENNTTQGDTTVKDVAEDIAQEHQEELGSQYSQESVQDLNDFFAQLQSESQPTDEISGKTK